MHREIRSLTSLRFLSAFWVFVFHVNIHWPLPLPGALTSIVENGPVAMSLFFILSGFVLGYSYQEKSLPLRTYLRRRMARIYPVYVFAALATLPFFTLYHQGILRYGEAIFVVVIDVLMLQAWFPSTIKYWNNGASWSISAEAFFYITFPLIIELLTRAGANSGSHLKIILVLYILSVIPGLSYLLVPESQPIFYAMPIFRLPEFALGVACAYGANRGLLRFRRPRSAAVAAIVVLLTFLIVMPRSNVYVSANAVVVPCIAVVILACAQAPVPFLNRPFLLLLGRASYSFYSLQPLVLLSIIKLQPSGSSWSPSLVLVLAFLILMSISLIIYRYVEEPARLWLLREPGELQRV